MKARAIAVLRWLYRSWLLVPITVVGLAVAGAAWWAFRAYGTGQSDFVLHTASVVALAMVAASVLFVVLAALYLWWRLRGARLTIERAVDVGTEMETGLEFPNLGWWPLVHVSMQWLTPGTADLDLRSEGGRFRERITPRERGRVRTIERRFTVSDILGLASVSFTRTVPAGLHVAPARAQADLSLAIRHAGGDGWSHPEGEPIGEYIEMRRYAHGDPLRLVLWKTFARTRRLLVRTPERAIAPQPSTVAYFVSGEGDEPSASTARAFLDHGLLGEDFLFFADGAQQVAADPGGALEALIDSVHFRDRGGEGLAGMAARVDRVKLANCVLFVPGRPGPWIDRVQTVARMLPAPPTIIMGVDGEVVESPKSRLVRFLREPPPPDAALQALPQLYDALRGLRGPVRIVHRPTGRLMRPNEIEALRDL